MSNPHGHVDAMAVAVRAGGGSSGKGGTGGQGPRVHLGMENQFWRFTLGNGGNIQQYDGCYGVRVWDPTIKGFGCMVLLPVGDGRRVQGSEAA